MDQLLESIRAATSTDASDEAKAAGVNACRAVLAALEAQEGKPLVAPTPPTTVTPDIAALVSGLKGVPVDQLLDLAIAKLRTMVPADHVPHVTHFAVPLVPLPRRT